MKQRWTGLLLVSCAITLSGTRSPGHGTLLATSRGAAQQDTAPSAKLPPGGTFLLRNVCIFDGARAIPANSVLVEAGTIARVGHDLTAETGVAVVDGTGLTLLPGLIDAHVHSYVRAALQQELMFGVTTELDMMDPPSFAIPIHKAQREGKERDTADIFTAGWAATCPGGHGAPPASPVPTITGPEQAQAWVDARIAEGSDYIKIVYGSGGALPSISRETMAALVKAAHKRGKMAVVHALTYRTATDVLDAGADGLAHLFADRAPEPGFARRIAGRRMFVISTLTPLDSYDLPNGAALATDPDIAPYLTQDAVANLKDTVVAKYHMTLPLKLEHAQAALRDMLAAHVPVLAGTDVPNPGTWYGASMHRELELLVRGGMKPPQALAAATSVPARTFQLRDRGAITPGLRADLLLVKGDPIHNILDTRRIVAIWKLGTPVDRMALRDTWKGNILREKSL